MEQRSRTFGEVIEKFNPNHDRLGRFSTASNAAFFTMRTKDPAKQAWADKALARAKNRYADNALNLSEHERRLISDQEGTIKRNRAAAELSDETISKFPGLKRKKAAAQRAIKDAEKKIEAIRERARDRAAQADNEEIPF